MNKIILSFVVCFISLAAFAQQGNNYNIDLADFDNYSEKTNIAFYADHIEKLDNSKECSYTSQVYDIPTISLNQDFIAVNTQVNYLLLEGQIEIFYKIKDGKKWKAWESILIDDHGNGILPSIYG